jgi:hypothetical protein
MSMGVFPDIANVFKKGLIFIFGVICGLGT